MTAPVNGIYFLFLKGELAYIGKSNDVHERIKSHARAGRTFDKSQFFECAAADTDWLEAEILRSLATKSNKYLTSARSAPASDMKTIGGVVLNAIRCAGGRHQFIDDIEAAAILGLSRGYLRALRVRGGGPPFSVFGKAVRYYEPGLMTWAMDKTVASTSQYQST